MTDIALPTLPDLSEDDNRVLARLPELPELDAATDLAIFGASWNVSVGHSGTDPCGLCGAPATIAVRLGHGGHYSCANCWEHVGRAKLETWHRNVTLPAIAGAFGATPFASSIVVRK